MLNFNRKLLSLLAWFAIALNPVLSYMGSIDTKTPCHKKTHLAHHQMKTDAMSNDVSKVCQNTSDHQQCCTSHACLDCAAQCVHSITVLFQSLSAVVFDKVDAFNRDTTKHKYSSIIGLLFKPPI